ncbi:hypothetical protein HG438_003815 [Candidatus Saccharibacteria bacterium]|nr:hypothetical protein [Candidatus Saccharibacteria bacterium]
MKSDVKHVKEAVDEIKRTLASQDNVSRSEHHELATLVSAMKESYDNRLNTLEGQNNVNAATFTGKLGKWFNDAMVQEIGKIIIAAILFHLYNNQITMQIQKTQDEINKTNHYVNSRLDAEAKK